MVTGCNHSWDQKEALVFIERAPRLLRPINFPPGTPGRGATLVEARNGVQAQIDKFLSINGTRSVESIHKELGQIMWEYCGMERTKEGLTEAIAKIRDLKKEFWTNVKVSGEQGIFNQNLEHAGRVADFIELAELMCVDALHRNESCGGHFRAESQTPEGEALRDDENYAYVAAWEYTPEGEPPVLPKEIVERTADRYRELIARLTA